METINTDHEGPFSAVLGHDLDITTIPGGSEALHIRQLIDEMGDRALKNAIEYAHEDI